MAAFKHVVALSVLVVVAAAITEGDVDGSLGYGRTFKFWVGLDFLGYADNVEPEECCAACKKTWPETETFDFTRGEGLREEGLKWCDCAKRNGHEKPITFSTLGWSAACNSSVNVSGGLGDGKAFITGVDRLFILPNIEDKTTCCQKCIEGHSGIQLVEYETRSSKTCECFEAGANPTTTSQSTYAGICR